MQTIDLDAIGFRISQKRKEKNVTQEELAEKAELSRNSINSIETRKETIMNEYHNSSENQLRTADEGLSNRLSTRSEELRRERPEPSAIRENKGAEPIPIPGIPSSLARPGQSTPSPLDRPTRGTKAH